MSPDRELANGVGRGKVRKLFYAVRIAVLTRTWLVESVSTLLAFESVFAKHHVETNCDHGTKTLLYSYYSRPRIGY